MQRLYETLATAMTDPASSGPAPSVATGSASQDPASPVHSLGIVKEVVNAFMSLPLVWLPDSVEGSFPSGGQTQAGSAHTVAAERSQSGHFYRCVSEVGG